MKSISEYILEKKSVLVTVDDPVAQEIEQGFLANCARSNSWLGFNKVDACAVIPSEFFPGKYDIIPTHGTVRDMSVIQILPDTGNWYTKVGCIHKENKTTEFSSPMYCARTTINGDDELIKVPEGIANYDFGGVIKMFDFQLPEQKVNITNADIRAFGKFNVGTLVLPTFEATTKARYDVLNLLRAGGSAERVVFGKATIQRIAQCNEPYTMPNMNYYDNKGNLVYVLNDQLNDVFEKIVSGLNCESAKYVSSGEFGDAKQFVRNANCEVIKDPKSGRWALVGQKRVRS